MSSATTEKPAPAAGGKGNRRRRPRPIRLVREVVVELRKVIWPTRRELAGYTAVVLVFVTAMVLIVAGMDFGFVKGAGWLFG